MGRSNRATAVTTDEVLAAAEAAQAAQRDCPAAPIPSRFQRRALLNPKCGEGMRRKQYFHFHPQATYATAYDVASWLDELDAIENGQ
jgi:hypothetical protein